MRDVFERTITACKGGLLTERALSELPLSPARYTLLAVGKAAGTMAQGVHTMLGEMVKRSLVVLPDGPPAPDGLPGAIIYRAAHPLPDERSVEAAEAVSSVIETLGANDHLIAAMSGGASALLCQPVEGIGLPELQEATRALLSHEIAIEDVNAVRKHISRIKGGRLAMRCKAPVTILALSDIPGGDLTALGSGPFSADSTTYEQAVEIAGRAGIEGRVLEELQAGAQGERNETPKTGDLRLKHVRTIQVGTPLTLRDEARGVLEADGFTVQELPLVKGTRVEELAERYASIARGIEVTDEARAWITVGEPSVRLKDPHGNGGRSQHLAMLMAEVLRDCPSVAFLAAGSDGIDGSGELAGAVVDSSTWSRARDPQTAVAGFDSARFHDDAGSGIRTGPTGTNLTDLHVLAVSKGVKSL